MIPINIGRGGNLGNKMFQYMYCRNLQSIIPQTRLGGYEMPQFGLSAPRLPTTGRILRVADGHKHNMSSIAYLLQQGIFESLLFEAYVQRLEYYPSADVCSSYFRATAIPDRTHLGPGNLTINIRGNEILAALHGDYGPAPVSFYEHVATTTKLSPVIMGQLGDNAYSDEIRRRFSGCIFLPSRSPAEDFEIVRNSTNIAISVSSFSWMAAWLSRTAQTIHLPILGLMHPKQRPDIDLLPTRDERYRFYQFPVEKWRASDAQVANLLCQRSEFREVYPADARALYPDW